MRSFDIELKLGIKMCKANPKFSPGTQQDMQHWPGKVRIDDDNFDTTLDFRVFLSNPDGCAISSDQILGLMYHALGKSCMANSVAQFCCPRSMCQVLIFDNDLFPSSAAQH